MLVLRPLDIHQYRQVAEWEEGRALGEDINWVRYEGEMGAPQWFHLAIYDGVSFVGAVSFEQINSHTMSYHVVTGRHQVHPQKLADLLLSTVSFFFRRGFTQLTVTIPKSNTAAARLALRCGMREFDIGSHSRHFVLSRAVFQKLRT